MLGVIPTRDALRLAQDQGLDLVEIAPNAEPPVCRVMDFGKYRYEESLKNRKARQQSAAHSKSVKEMKFHANVEEHDYQTKVRHVREFLQDGHKVKLTLQFRGRENAHRELGMQLVSRVLKDCEDVGAVEMAPKMIGRLIVAMLGVRTGKAQPKRLDRPAGVGYSPAPVVSEPKATAAAPPAAPGPAENQGVSQPC
jgi:translation initiation factor IF-3